MPVSQALCRRPLLTRGPVDGDLRPANTALVVIDMQTGFSAASAAMSTGWATTCH